MDTEAKTPAVAIRPTTDIAHRFLENPILQPRDIDTSASGMKIE